jgi:hypothetical protein
MSGSIHSHPRYRPWRLIAALAISLLVLVAVFIFPGLALPALVLALAGLTYERLRTDRAIERLTRQLADDGAAAKIEVNEGRWSKLHYALNRLLQQRRAQQHLQALLPTWPPGAADLLAAQIPPEGLPRQVVALAVGLPALPVEVLQRLAAIAASQADEQTALIDWSGDALLLVFGAFSEQSRVDLLRAALRTARQIRAAAPKVGLSMALSAGLARALVLPGLGYIVLGEPVAQALNLCDSAAVHGQSALFCTEELYLALRHIGGPSALPANLRSDSQPVYAIAL